MTIFYNYKIKGKEKTFSNSIVFPPNEKEYIFKILSVLRKEHKNKNINMQIIKIKN